MTPRPDRFRVRFRLTALCLALSILSEYGFAAQYIWEFSSKERVDFDVKAAAAGDGRAMADLGWRYVVRTRGRWKPNEVEPFPTGVRQDNAEALRWFRQGAEAGNGRAMANLGWMYLSGNGVKQDSTEAARWFRRGAEAGDGRAMGSLGALYLIGAGLQKDPAEATRWFRRGADTQYARIPKFAEDLGAFPGRYSPTGDARSMGNLGLMFLDGRGVPKDEAEGVRWLQLAAKARDRQAIFHLAVLSATGAAGVKKESDVSMLKHMFAQVESAPGDAFSADDMTFGDGMPEQMRKAAGEYYRNLNPPTIARWTTTDVLIGASLLYILIAALTPGSAPDYRRDADPLRHLGDICGNPVGFNFVC
jgi:TPR repeat protein